MAARTLWDRLPGPWRLRKSLLQVARTRDVTSGLQSPWSSQHKPDLAMIRVCQACASITGKGMGQLPPNSPASLFAPTTPLPHCSWPASCLLLSGHTQLHGLARASPAACDLFGSSRLLVPGSAIVFHEAGGQSHLLLEASFGMNPFS